MDSWKSRVSVVLLCVALCAFCSWLLIATDQIFVPEICHQADIINVPDSSGRLLFLKEVSEEKEPVIYQLTSGMDKPQELYRLQITHTVHNIYPFSAYVSSDRRYVVLDDGYLVDLDSGDYKMLPDLYENGGVDRGAFSPDGKYFAYVSLLNTPGTPAALLVYSLETQKDVVLYTAPCATYGGDICGRLGNFRWIDTTHILLSHVAGMPLTYQFPGPNPDAVSVLDLHGTAQNRYSTSVRIVGVTATNVIVSDGGSLKQVEISGLLAGKFASHDIGSVFDRTTIAPDLAGIDFLVSPDGQNGLSTGKPWKLTNFQTGSVQSLGTIDALERVDNCVWSPDGASVACQGLEPRKFGGCHFSDMLIAPLSEAQSKIMFRSDRLSSGQDLWYQWGNLLTWQP